MCIILFAYHQHPQYKLIMLANRDEYYHRPTTKAEFWKDNPMILAGRDLEQLGTWMGITKSGRIAAITNYRDPRREIENAISRGNVVRNYLESNSNPNDYIQLISEQRDAYNGFNLILGNANELKYYSNITNKLESVKKGIHGLSNHLFNTDWPKIKLGKEMLGTCLKESTINIDCLFDILQNETVPKDEALPDTGVGIIYERLLAPIYIRSKEYGTRSSTILLIDQDDQVIFQERSYLNNKIEQVEYQFGLNGSNV